MTVKISNLPAATSVGSGDVIPVVQSGTTKKVDLNANWSFGGDVNFDSGTLFVDASTNRVGIGTTSPANPVTVNVGTASTGYNNSFAIQHSGTEVFKITSGPITTLAGGTAPNNAVRLTTLNDTATHYEVGSDFHSWDTATNGECMRIDSSGRVGIGTTSPSEKLEVREGYIATHHDVNTTGAGYAIRFYTNGGSGGAKAVMAEISGIQESSDNGRIIFNTRTSGTNSEKMRIDSSGNVLIGQTSSYLTAANRIVTHIKGGTDGSVLGLISSAGDFYIHAGPSNIANVDIVNRANGNMTFYTDNSPRMRIDSSGNVLIGKTTTAATSRGYFIDQNGEASFAQPATGRAIGFFNSGTGSLVGSIVVNASSTSYNTSSDYRLKENILDAEEAGAKVDAIKVRQFDWKADGSHQDYGMIAQELLTVAPEAVSGDPESDEMMGIDYSKLVPMLVKEIQSLRARVHALESQ